MSKDCIIQYKGKGYSPSELKLYLEENSKSDDFIEMAKELGVEYNTNEEDSDDFDVESSMGSFTKSKTKSDKELSLGHVDSKHIDKVTDVYDVIKETQEKITKKEEGYYLNGVKHERVSNIKGTIFEGDSSNFDNAREAGNTIDSVVRDFINGEELNWEKYKSKFGDEKAFNDLIKDVKERIDVLKSIGC